MPQPSSQPTRACCLYSLEDDDLCREFAVHLEPLVQSRLLDCHYQHRVSPGLDFREAVERQIDQARLIFILVSPDFLARHSTQAYRALARTRDPSSEARVVPIACRAVDWELTPFEHLSISPRSRKPLGGLIHRDEAWSAILADIKTALSELGSASSPALKRTWCLPGRRNLHFSGRVTLLKDLATALSRTPRLLAVVGMGGVGKTQLVMEHLYQHAAEYPVVFWANAEAKATLAGEYARFAAALGLRGNETQQQVLRWLAEQGRFLLILDNANNYQEVEDYLPPSDNGHVIITSRNPDWGDVWQVLRVRKFEPAESCSFLLQRTGQSDTAAAARLATELDHLPLALAQAAAYIERTGKSLAEYLALYQRRPRELRAMGVVATTWDLSFAALHAAEATRPAVALMGLCAFLSSESISVVDLLGWADYVPKSLAVCLRDEVKLDHLIGSLRGYSLMERSEGMLSMHRLVQAVVGDRMAAAHRRRWINAAQSAILASFVFRADRAETWVVCSRLLPHALAVTRHADSEGIASRMTAEILNRIGLYLLHRAEFREAQRVLERALSISEKEPGQEDPVLVVRLTNLADTMREQGLHAQASQLLRRALNLAERVYGPGHPLVGCVLNNLGLILYDQCDRQGARRHLAKAMQLLQQPTARESSQLACCLNNFGVLLYWSGDMERARARLEQGRTLAMMRPALRAAIENNLGQISQEEGNRKQALQTYKGALELVESTHGPMHPLIACVLHKRSRVQWELGQLQEAYVDCQRALVIAEQVYGLENPAVAGLLETLGGIVYQMGDRHAASQIVEKAVRIFENILGAQHPRTTEALHVLGVVAPQPG